VLQDKDSCLLSLVKYIQIHLRPVRVKISRRPEEDLWSNHHAYINNPDRKSIVDEDQLLRMFSEAKGRPGDSIRRL